MTKTAQSTKPMSSKPKRTKIATSNPAKKATTAPASAAPTVKPATKKDQLIALLVRDEGASIEQMTKATGWLPHTVRAAMTGLRKRGYAIDSDKMDGVRTYRAVAPE